ncbi:unnamed protein product [Lactuca saligna]|uniref:Uncharacterized protein n=1 Tax=Lactuca saligna TaxID=75948 RepID=A0AA35Z2T1_LACSI|nr:unnamed protein product [Lactuca saligna]
MTPKNNVKSIDMENDLLKSDANRRGFNSMPVDVPVAGPVDVDVGPIDVDGFGTVPAIPIATMAGPTVEAVQGLGDDDVSAKSFSQPPGFRRDVELDSRTSKMRSISASSHGSSGLLKK